MNIRSLLVLSPVASVIVGASACLYGQVPTSTKTPDAATAPTAVPALIPYAALAESAPGKPLSASGDLQMTFLLFKEQQGGEPLWVESQMVALDPQGHYQVQLGAGSANGIPLHTFASGESRWLEVQIAGEAPQPRVLLMSVPYAMKAADASTLGGLPASAFMLAGSAATSTVDAQATPATTPSTTVTTPGGTAGYLPVFSASSKIDDSPVFQSGTNIGINTATPAATLDVNGAIDARGPLTLESTGTATSSGGKNSQPLQFTGSSYSTSTKKATPPTFLLQSEASGNDTSTPAATLNLLYGNGATPAETGLSISSKGLLTFATGQKFPGTGTGTITGITTTSPLAGSGTTGSIALSLNTSALETTLNGKYGQLAAGNTFSGANTFTAPITFASSQTFPGTGKGTITGVTPGTGLTGGGTSGAVTLTVDTTKIPTLTDNPTFTGTITAKNSNNGGYAIVAAGTNGATGVNSTSDSAWAGRFGNSSSEYASIFSTSSASTGGWSFYGNTAGKDGIGLYAIASGAGGYGVEGIADGAEDSSGNPAIGVYGSAATGYGVFGTASNGGDGVVGVSTAGPGTGVYGVSEAGNAAAFFNHTDATPAVLALTSGDFGASGTGNFPMAIYGAAFGTQAIGIEGDSGNAFGVYGTSAGASTTGSNMLDAGGIAGVAGDSKISGNQVTDLGGVAGFADDNTAATFVNNSANYATLYVVNSGAGGTGLFKTFEASSSGGTCGVGSTGDLTCTGQIKALATTGDARTVETYSVQSPENWMEDFGSGSLQHGVATVTLDAAFAETVSANAGYHVFLTPRGDSKGLYVTHLTATSFEVHESGSGTSTLDFDYRIVAKRRGYEAQRMVDVTERLRAATERTTGRMAMATTNRGTHRNAPTLPALPSIRTPRPAQMQPADPHRLPTQGVAVNRQHSN